MNSAEYFESVEGVGVLATAGTDGAVTAAVYARPRFISADQVAFVMAERLSHANVVANPRACYLFIEKGTVDRGRRLFLSRLREEKIQLGAGTQFLVTFRIDRELPLICTDDTGPTG